MTDEMPEEIWLTNNPKHYRTWFFRKGITKFVHTKYIRADLDVQKTPDLIDKEVCASGVNDKMEDNE